MSYLLLLCLFRLWAVFFCVFWRHEMNRSATLSAVNRCPSACSRRQLTAWILCLCESLSPSSALCFFMLTCCKLAPDLSGSTTVCCGKDHVRLWLGQCLICASWWTTLGFIFPLPHLCHKIWNFWALWTFCLIAFMRSWLFTTDLNLILTC